MHKLKDKLMYMLKEYEDKMKGSGRASESDIQRIHFLAATIKDLCKIEMYEEYEGESSEDGYSSRRGRGRYAKRDSMGRYSRDSYRSYDSGDSYEEDSYGRGSSRYSRAGSKGKMREHLQEMMDEAENSEQREIISKFKEMLENS